MFAYVGSRTTKERNARGLGISVYEVNEASGALTLLQVHGNLVNPSFLALNRSNTRLYAVHGDMDYISAFEVSPNGHIKLLNQESTQGKNPVHLALDPSEQFIVVSNHLSESLAVLPIAPDGSLQPVKQLVQIEGTPGPHRKEQPHAKPHFNAFDPSGKFVLVPDKGLDKTFVFRFNDGNLSRAEHPEMLGREGSGPRHLAFHPSAKFAYVINELDSTVTACRFETAKGVLTALQIASSLADTFTGNSRASEIECSKDGRFLYASNRGEESIAVFSIDQSSGRIALIQTQACQGKTPRFFTLAPNRKNCYALNEDSDSIEVFSVDSSEGRISHAGKRYSSGSPVCMVFSS